MLTQIVQSFLREIIKIDGRPSIKSSCQNNREAEFLAKKYFILKGYPRQAKAKAVFAFAPMGPKAIKEVTLLSLSLGLGIPIEINVILPSDVALLGVGRPLKVFYYFIIVRNSIP